MLLRHRYYLDGSVARTTVAERCLMSPWQHQGFPHPQSSDFLLKAQIFFGMLDFFSRFDDDLVIAQISIRGTRSQRHILVRERAHSN